VYTAGVLSGKTITAISAGGKHTCALATNLAYCWGYNTNGQLGDNTLTQQQMPVAVYTAGGLSGKTVTRIDTNLTNTCVIASGVAYCWGLNTYGQVGDGTLVQKQVPTAVIATGVLSGKTLTSIKVGGYMACAMTSTNNYCWGFGGSGQLGNGSTTSSSVPVQVTNP
jgi:alpha-tubulin suppressor-like RCC1 family protein